MLARRIQQFPAKPDYCRLLSATGFFLGVEAGAVSFSGIVSSTMIFFTPWSVTILSEDEEVVACGARWDAGAENET